MQNDAEQLRRLLIEDNSLHCDFFNFVTESVLRKVTEHRNVIILNKSLLSLLSATSIVIDTKQDFTHILSAIVRESFKMGLAVNGAKQVYISDSTLLKSL